DRQAGIAALTSHNLGGYPRDGWTGRMLPIQEYAHILMRSKIALNFCTVGDDPSKQIKGRVYEATACGAMLLEAEGDETSRWFEPMVDYVPFSDELDLVEKARYYLEHDEERMEIAARGHRKAKEQYNGEMFWNTIFNKVRDTSDWRFTPGNYPW
ncbi:MAG: glycosyltransferase, partial [Chloroflexi bacterium]|nr:glycosyltransferase [Chloroflexota bacterium]